MNRGTPIPDGDSRHFTKRPRNITRRPVVCNPVDSLNIPT